MQFNYTVIMNVGAKYFFVNVCLAILSKALLMSFVIGNVFLKGLASLRPAFILCNSTVKRVLLEYFLKRNRIDDKGTGKEKNQSLSLLMESRKCNIST